MPATTQNQKLPYPLPTDPIADGANQIKALAEAVDTRLVKLAVVKINATSDKTSGNFHEVTGTAPLPEGFTKLIGGFVAYTYLLAQHNDFVDYFTVSTLTIENDGTQIKVSGISSMSGNDLDINALVWGY